MFILKFEAILAILIFSFVPLAIKLTGANPYTIGVFRLIISSLFIFLWWRKKIKISMFLNRESYRLPLIGLIFACHWITYFFAIKIGGPEACVLGMSTYGIQLILFGSYFLNYHLKLSNYASLLIVFLGLCLVLPEISFNNDFSLGLLLGVVSASFYSLMPIIHQKANNFFQHEVRIFSQFFFALIIFSLFYSKTDWNLTTTDWGGLIYLAIFGTLIAHSLWARVTSQLPTYISGIIYYAITPCALFISHLVFKDTLSTKQIIGACLIVVGAIFNIWSTHDKNRTT